MKMDEEEKESKEAEQFLKEIQNNPALISSLKLAMITTITERVKNKDMVLKSKMNFLELYEEVYARIEELKNKGLEEKEARELAWEQIHNKIFT